MKITNLAVVFVVIAFTIILVVVNYISFQADTLTKQNEYNAKLIDSTKEAIDAFEINTVELNPNYSETGDSKRRDIRASINTFITSFANNLGISGTSKEGILAYVPAIAYTLYDGYYIYTPARVKQAVTDNKGVRVVMTEKLALDNTKIDGYVYNADDEGKILYVATAENEDGEYIRGADRIRFTLDSEHAEDGGYNHILKPFVAYSEKATAYPGTDNKEVVVNYTLDNYVTVYGNLREVDGTWENIKKSGYLTLNDKIKLNVANTGNINGITYDDKTIGPETLSETIAYRDNLNDNLTTSPFNYVYSYDYSQGDIKKIKVYYESNIASAHYQEFFKLEPDDLTRTWVDGLTGEKGKLYKECTIPVYSAGMWGYEKRYKSLVSTDGNWYKQTSPGAYEINNDYDAILNVYSDITDFSAINYCVESYCFTQWFNTLNLRVQDVEINDAGIAVPVGTPYNITTDGNDPEAENSIFTQHKRQVIKYVIESNLNQSITSYSRNTQGQYQLPKLTEWDWDQLLRNVSIIAFVQNMPIGLKYYNNYAIATSTQNKEFVDPNEIYLYSPTDNSQDYHKYLCDDLVDGPDKIGYRSIDFKAKPYKVGDETRYYFKHENSWGQDINQSCYRCLVQRSLFEPEPNAISKDQKETAYYTALARERYISRK